MIQTVLTGQHLNKLLIIRVLMGRGYESEHHRATFNRQWEIVRRDSMVCSSTFFFFFFGQVSLTYQYWSFLFVVMSYTLCRASCRPYPPIRRAF